MTNIAALRRMAVILESNLHGKDDLVHDLPTIMIEDFLEIIRKLETRLRANNEHFRRVKNELMSAHHRVHNALNEVHSMRIMNDSMRDLIVEITKEGPDESDIAITGSTGV